MAFLRKPFATACVIFQRETSWSVGVQQESKVLKTWVWDSISQPSFGLFCSCSNREALLEFSRKFGSLARHKFRPLDILFLIDKHGWVFVNEKKSIRLWYEDFTSHFFLFILGFFFGQEWKSLCTKEKWCPQMKYVFTDVFWSAQCEPSAFWDSGSCWSWSRHVETGFVHLLAFLWILIILRCLLEVKVFIVY